MKSLIPIVAIVLLITGSRCTTITPTTHSALDEVIVISVECLNQRSTHNNVVLLLRQERVSDWTFRDLGSTELIEARYASLHPARAERIKELLTQSGGIITVEIKKDGLPVKNIR
jgi:hypothetical protein